MNSRGRILVLGKLPDPLATCLSEFDIVYCGDDNDACRLLQMEQFEALIVSETAAKELLSNNQRDEIVLNHIDQGVAVLDDQCRIVWSNPALKRFCLVEHCHGVPILDALGASTLVADVPEPLKLAQKGRSVGFRVYRPQVNIGAYLDVALQPIEVTEQGAGKMILLVRNVTPEVEQQRKLDALHQAGRELADLDPDQLAEMNLPTRVELLKQNLRRYIHDLLNYDIIEIRLLDRRTGQLQPLLEDGMTPEASRRVLYARDSGNGVTGYVAATGKSYLCMDTALDPLYLEGATGARSSLTVPLKYHDEVVGTLNVESPQSRGFGPEDLQFTELFSKEIATALHTLDLLSAQQTFTAEHSLDLINREIAIPMDDVLAGAAVLLDRFQETDPTTAEQVRRILDAAKLVKQSIRKVAQDLQCDREHLSRRSSPLQGKRILIVDAEDRFRKASHLMLSQLGAEVETAGTAREAISLARAIDFDAVFMDVKPPDLGGFDTYQRIKQANPNARISMMTGFGYDSAHAIVKARADGMKYVLFKPFRQDQVLKAVLEPDGSGVVPQPANDRPTPTPATENNGRPTA